MPVCSLCKEDKLEERFDKSSTKKNGLRAACKTCRAARNKTWWNAKDGDYQRDRHYRAAYGITLADYNRLLEEQNFSCAICKSTSCGRYKHFSVDHCHNTKVVRGLLCSECNLGLGKFKDNLALLEDAVNYLKAK